MRHVLSRDRAFLAARPGAGGADIRVPADDPQYWFGLAKVH